ncbi:MAG: helix-turn-helix domain-containing protein [Actinomycetota bacterium]
MAGRTRTDRWPCPVARTADLLSDQWMIVILRDSAFGIRRFDDFQRSLEVSRSVLTTRLNRLVEDGFLEKVAYQDHPPRHEYVPTEKAEAFWPVLAAMWRYGDEWLFRNGAPVELIDRDTGDQVRAIVVDEATGEPLDPDRIRVRIRRD